ncbi:unnamed protein product [Heterobilharzia americana]|nr:unnamed protein product [Heterobilharzia americana]
MQVLERRIKIFLHNRYTVVQPIPVIYLDTVIESDRGSSSGRRKSVSLSESSSKTYLMARNDAELFIPQDPKCAIVFILEYVLCEITSSTVPLKFNCTVRWATYALEDNMELLKSGENHSITLNLSLRGSVQPVIDSKDTDVIQTEDIDSFEKSLLKTVCPDGSLCFTENVRSTMGLVLSCTLSTGIRKEMGENSVAEETIVITKQSKGEFQAPIVRQDILNSQSNGSLQSQIDVISPRKKQIQLNKQKFKSKHPMKGNLVFNDIKQSDEIEQFNANILPIPIQAQFNLYTQLLQQQQQQMGLLNPYVSFLNRGTMIGPYLGGIGPTLYEPLEASLPLIGPFMDKKANGPLILLSNTHSCIGLSRAAYAKLYSAGFESIQTENGDPPFTIDPHTDTIGDFVFKKEEMDVLTQNEIIIQFLAYSGFEPTVQSVDIPDLPEQIYLTFQFYRFPQIKTPTLFIGKSLEDSVDSAGMTCRIIWKSKPQVEKLSLSEIKSSLPSTKVETKVPGYKIIFHIDQNYFKPGELEIFFNYLIRTNMQIDVWNAKSHILIGSCMVELKHLCRQGRQAVQSMIPPDIQGRLHLRLANVGHCKEPREINVRIANRKKYLINESDAGCLGKFKGGALSNLNLMKQKEVNMNSTGLIIRAYKIKSTNNELQEMLKLINLSSEKRIPTSITSMKLINNENRMKKLSYQDEMIRQEKLERLHRSLKAIQGSSNVYNEKVSSKIFNINNLLTEKKLQLDTINHYREQKKRELIEFMINNASTIEHDLYTSFGCTEFFEYQLKNPYHIEDNVCIKIEDDSNSLSVVIDSREVRALKLAFGIDTPTEDNLFAIDLTNDDYTTEQKSNTERKLLKKNNVTLFLKPNETVLLPMKYEESTMFHNAKQYEGVDERSLSEFISSVEDKPTHMNRVVQVIFKSTTYGKIISQLILHVHIQPPIIDHSFRFFHPELSYLKKILRLPRNAIDWRNIYMPDQIIQPINYQLWTRVSDQDVLTLSNVQGDTIDLLIKVGLGKSPQIREFLISVYVEPFQIRPAYIWYWAIHSLQRIDAVATIGQSSAPIGLLLRTDDCSPNIGSKRISIYTSHPNEVLVGTEFTSNGLQQNPIGKELTLSVSSRSVYELKVKLCPRCAGKKIYQINVVDPDIQRVLRAWILCVDVKQPEITKSFNIKLPKQGINETCNKRITYTNPYQYNKTLILETNRPNLVQFKESIIEIPAAGTIQIGLRFIPQRTIDSEQIYIFIKDEQGKNLETFSVIAQYY